MGSEVTEVLDLVRQLQVQVQQLSLEVGRLSLAVHSRHNSPPSTLAGYPGVGSPLRAPSVSSSTSADYNSLAIQIPVVPSAVRDLGSSLRRTDASDRIERAWIIGYWARFVLAGRISKPRPSTACSLANTTYVVLRAPGFTCPLVCVRGSDYRHVVGNFDRETLSHGFASVAEAKIYCAGAGVEYPATTFEWRPQQ